MDLVKNSRFLIKIEYQKQSATGIKHLKYQVKFLKEFDLYVFVNEYDFEKKSVNINLNTLKFLFSQKN